MACAGAVGMEIYDAHKTDRQRLYRNKTAEMGPRIVSLCGPTNAPSGTRGPDDLGLVGGAGSNKVDYTARALYYVWTKPAWGGYVI